MQHIRFCSPDTAFMQHLSDQLSEDLENAGLADALSIRPAITESETHTRGEPMTVTTIALVAAGAGGALTALLGKDGFLSALARVLEKYVEGRQVEVSIEKESGEVVQLKGPIGEIKAILKQLQE